MKQNLYLCIFAICIFYLPAFASERYRESILTGLMPQPQLKVITLSSDGGYTLNRSKIRHVIDLSHEDQENYAETYMAVFDQEGMVTFSYFHKGPNIGQLLVYLEDPRKQPLKGQATDFNYLKKRYLENKPSK